MGGAGPPSLSGNRGNPLLWSRLAAWRCEPSCGSTPGPAGRSLEYEAAEGMPSFIVRAVNRWSVHTGPGGTCVVRVHATLTLRPWARALGPLLRWRMRAGSRQVLDDLRHRVETGLPHPRKAAALAGRVSQP